MANDFHCAFASEGRLGEGDLFSLLHHIHLDEISGELEVKTDDCRKEMVVRDGKIVFASSNRKTDTLGQYLLRKKRIDSNVYNTASRYMQKHKKRFGRAAIELGFFTYDQIWTWVPEHLKFIVLSFFDIPSGVYRIREKRERDMDMENIVLDLDIPALLVEAMRGFKSGTFIQKKFETVRHLYVCPADAVAVARLDLKPYEMHVLDLVRRQSRLENILKHSELLERDTLRFLYLFLVLGLISDRERDRAQTRGSQSPVTAPTPSRISTFNSFEEAVKYYNLKYEMIYKVMLKQIGPISLSLLLKAIEDIMDNLPSYFQKIQLNPDGTINEEAILNALWYYDFDRHIGPLLKGLEEVLYAEIYAVRKHLGGESEQQVLRWIKGIGN
jgi:hypothetical protein